MHCDCGDGPVFQFEQCYKEHEIDDVSPTRVVSDEDRSDFNVVFSDLSQ